MKIIAFLISALLSPVLWAFGDCSFDQQNQMAVLKTIAQSNPGAKLNLKRHKVSWGDTDSEMTIFTFGGCEDLGSTVSRTNPMKSPRTREQVFSLARELAMRFWSNKEVGAGSATDALLAGLSAKRFQVDKMNDSTMYSVSNEAYVELYVAHAYADGIDTVTIVWQGNF